VAAQTRFRRLSHIAMGLSIAAAISNSAVAEVTPVDGNPTLMRASYYQAIICFVANGHAKGLRERAGDMKKAAVYGKLEHDSYLVALGAGQQLAFTNDRIEADFASVQKSELPLMVKDETYFFKEVAACKAIGLM
jgi:hypothetical protein